VESLLSPTVPAPEAICLCAKLLCWSWVHPAGRIVSAHTEDSSLCALHSNPWLCPLLLGCSFAGKHCFWNLLWKQWICLSLRHCNQLHNYQLFKNNVWVPSLETDRTRSSSNHGRWIQRLHKRVSGTLQVKLHLPQIPLVGPHTGHLQTQYIVCAQDLQSCNSV
jgi:hypothetical protein